MTLEPLPRTRAEARKAGAAFGEKVATATSRAILDCPDAERTDAFVDGLTARALLEMEAAATAFRSAGIPIVLVERFKTAFLRALRDRAGLMHRAASADGRAN